MFGYQSPYSTSVMDFCGCYYSAPSDVFETRQYLPLLDSEVHSTILSTTSRTTLKQKFTNPSPLFAIKECTYTFPLYDGVSVVSFTCRIGKKVLTGLVKEKAKAREIFDQAVAKGETAGLLQQAPEASDIFSTKLGNIPAGESVIVEIAYVGELKHHETEGIRFTIPTRIASRYGAGPNHGFSTSGSPMGSDSGAIKIVVDVNMPAGSFIKGVQSPSHPIAVSMGTVSTATNDDPTMSKASATLSLGSSALEKDFVLIVQSKDVGIPKAILETHPTIPNQRAMMATLVPKFSLPLSRSEIVFVADRSGSMHGNIEMLVSAMKVFLKSLPQNVMFNICSFGSMHTFLWEKSQSSTRDTIDEALNHVQTFSANMSGTETFGAIMGTVQRRMTDIPLEVILLTDGDISRQNELFEYVNQQVEATKGNIRVFPLGIGNGVSHSLIEGLARAGNGFAQAVQIGERLDNAVVRMLRGALSPHITDYTLEVKYEREISDDYDLVDRVTDSMKVMLTNDTRSLKSAFSSTSPTPKPTISLFDANMEPEQDIHETSIVIPSISSPKILQAPTKIPTLFAFSRTTVYLLMSPDTIQRKPIAVVLRGTSAHGPLALEIPVDILLSPAETIHQLATKKAVQDLEEGRGWIVNAKDQDGALIKDKYPSCFQDMVKREAVRLGEQFQIAGKWCSFVAVEANDEEIEEKKQKAAVAKLSVELDIPESDNDAQNDSEESELETFEIVPAPPIGGQIANYYIPYAIDSRRNIVESPSGSSANAQPPPPYQPSGGGGGLFGGPQYKPAQTPAISQHPSTLFGNLASASFTPQDSSLSWLEQQKKAQQEMMIQRQCLEQQSKPRKAPQFQEIDSGGSMAGIRHGPCPDIHTALAAEPGMTRSRNQLGSSSLFPNLASTSVGQQALSQQQRIQIAMAQRQAQAGHQSNAINLPPLLGPQGPYFNQSGQERNKGSSSRGSIDEAYHGPSAEHLATLATEPQRRNKKIQQAPKSESVASSSPVPALPPAFAPSSEMKAFRQRPHTQTHTEKSNPAPYHNEKIMDLDFVPAPVDWTTKSISDKVLALIELQDYEGWWYIGAKDVETISEITGVNIDDLKDEDEKKRIVTLLVVKFLEEKCAREEGTWGLVVEKARAWLEGLGVELKGLEEKVGQLLE